MKNVYRLTLLMIVVSVATGCMMFTGGGKLPKPVPPRIKSFPHLVKRGETIFAIARYYNAKPAIIKSINGLDDDRDLKVGTIIQIPGERPKRPAANSLDYIMNVQAKFRPWRYIVVHHSATDVGNMALFDKEHRHKGWRGVGYDFVIDNGSSGMRDGQIEVTPRWTKQMVGSHCRSPNNEMNKYGIGICLVGDFTKREPSQAQMQSLVNLIRFLQVKFRIPGRKVFGHRDAPDAATECPGKRFPMRKLKSYLYK